MTTKEIVFATIVCAFIGGCIGVALAAVVFVP